MRMQSPCERSPIFGPDYAKGGPVWLMTGKAPADFAVCTASADPVNGPSHPAGKNNLLNSVS
jgi:hypothetical protein